MSDHPYKDYEKTETWKLVEKAIDSLVRNGDLVEQTPRDYIVGHITQSLLRRQLSSRKLESTRKKFARLADASQAAQMALVELELKSHAK